MSSDLSQSHDTPNKPEKAPVETDEKRILAFKALPADIATSHHESSATGSSTDSEQAQVLNICHEIERACRNGGFIKSSKTGTKSKVSEMFDISEPSDDAATASKSVMKEDSFVVEEDIINLSQAKKSTGLLEQVGYSIRRLVWA